jgi:hypothetical protein
VGILFMQFDDAGVPLLGFEKVEGPFTFQGEHIVLVRHH